MQAGIPAGGGTGTAGNGVNASSAVTQEAHAPRRNGTRSAPQPAHAPGRTRSASAAPSPSSSDIGSPRSVEEEGGGHLGAGPRVGQRLSQVAQADLLRTGLVVPDAVELVRDRNADPGALRRA